MSAVNRDVFGAVVCTGIDAAGAASAPGHVLDTRDVLLALMRADAGGAWDRIALDFGDVDAVRWAPVADPQPEAAGAWGATPLSRTCTAALARAALLAEAYESQPVSVGLLVVALIAEPNSAAALALTGGRPQRTAELMTAVQDEIVGATLVDLDEALREPALTMPAADARGGTFDDVLAALGGADRLANSDALGLLAAALRVTRDEELAGRFERMLFEAEAVESVRPTVASLPTASAAEIVDRARSRFDTDRPDARQLIVAATHRPAPRTARALWLLGYPDKAVAFEAATADADANRFGEKFSDRTTVYTTLNAVLSAAVTAFIVRHVVVANDWWPGILVAFVLIQLTWSGHLVGNIVLTAVLLVWADPVTAVIASAMTVADLLMTRSEMRNALHRTGIAVTMPQWRRHLRIRYPRSSTPVTAAIRWRRAARLAAQEGAAA